MYEYCPRLRFERTSQSRKTACSPSSSAMLSKTNRLRISSHEGCCAPMAMASSSRDATSPCEGTRDDIIRGRRRLPLGVPLFGALGVQLGVQPGAQLGAPLGVQLGVQSWRRGKGRGRR